jgi:hypothetical protein
MTNINVSTPNDGLGDKLRDAMIICNDNFAELSSISTTLEADILAIQSAIDDLAQPPFQISDVAGLQSALDNLVSLSDYNSNNILINAAIAEINANIDFILANLAASGVLSQYTIDEYQGTRLLATASTNGFLTEKSINGAVGYIASNTNTGSGALASVVALGDATDGDYTNGLYSNALSLNWANSGYSAAYLRNCGFLYSANKSHIIAESIDFRTGPIATAATRLSISAGGTVSLGNLPALDAITDDLLARNASGEVVRVSKASMIAIGTSGTSGTSGVNGTSGTSGAQGSSGVSGSNGTSGTSGVSGSNGSSGTSGAQGSSGVSGSNGTSGTSGVNGANGATGSNGSNGSSGTSGINGGSQISRTYSNGTASIVAPGEVFSLTDLYFYNGPTSSFYLIPGGQPWTIFANGVIDLNNYMIGYINSVDVEPPSLGFMILESYGSATDSNEWYAIQGAITKSGTSGTSGVDGSSGVAGATGATGSNGSNGSNGTSGTSGTSGSQGPSGISAGQIYYFNLSSTGSVAGYRDLSTTPLPNGGTYSTTTLTGNQQGVLVKQFITDELGFSIIPGGSQRFHLHFLKPAENDNIEAYVEIRLTDSAGTPIGPTISSNKALIGWVDAINTVETLVDITLPTTAIDPTNKMAAYIRLDNNDSSSHAVQWHTEGSNDYSYVVTSIAAASGTSGTSGVNGTSGTSGVNGAVGATGPAGGITITQINGVVLTGASWSLVSGFYEYNHSDAAITSTSVVEVIPDNASISIVNAAAVLPRTDSATASVKLYATNLPTGNITTTINIYK